MSILTHPLWPVLRPFVTIQRYGRDTGPRGARWRIEIGKPADGILLRQLLAIVMPCVHCGRPIHPVRLRGGRPGLYFAGTCGLDVTFKCSRSAAARQEYLVVKRAMAEWQRRAGADLH